MLTRIGLALAAAAIWLAPAGAQGLRQVPLGFCSLATMTASTALSTCMGGVPSGTQNIVVCAYTQGVVWRDDGTAPTGTPGTGGQGLNAGQCMTYNGNFTQIRFIQQAGGAILGVNFYG